MKKGDWFDFALEHSHIRADIYRLAGKYGELGFAKDAPVFSVLRELPVAIFPGDIDSLLKSSNGIPPERAERATEQIRSLVKTLEGIPPAA